MSDKRKTDTISLRLATGTAASQPTGVYGRAITAVRGHHFIIDAPLSLGGPNEEVTPFDLLLSSLATYATFICERVAQERGIQFGRLTVTATGECDPRAIRGETGDPRIQALRLRVALDGVHDWPNVTRDLADAIRKRCPIYSTLAQTMPIGIEVLVDSRLASSA